MVAPSLWRVGVGVRVRLRSLLYFRSGAGARAAHPPLPPQRCFTHARPAPLLVKKDTTSTVQKLPSPPALPPPSTPPSPSPTGHARARRLSLSATGTPHANIASWCPPAPLLHTTPTLNPRNPSVLAPFTPTSSQPIHAPTRSLITLAALLHTPLTPPFTSVHTPFTLALLGASPLQRDHPPRGVLGLPRMDLRLPAPPRPAPLHGGMHRARGGNEAALCAAPSKPLFAPPALAPQKRRGKGPPISPISNPLAGGHRLLEFAHAAAAPRLGPPSIRGHDDAVQRRGGLLDLPMAQAAARPVRIYS